MYPDWGFSYSALYVPIGRNTWQCALMVPSEIQSALQRRSRNQFEKKVRLVRNYRYSAQSQPFKTPSRYRSSSWGYSTLDEDDGSELWMTNRLKLDRDDFIQWFDVRIDERESRGSYESDHYMRFLRDRLRLSRWNMPVDGAGIARILKDAVRDGRLIAVMNRNYSGNRKVCRHYAPQRWPAFGGGLRSAKSIKSISWAEFSALREAHGELGASLISVSDLSSKAAGLEAAASASDRFGATVGRIRSAGTDWLGTALEVASTVAEEMPGTTDVESGNPLLKSLSDGDTPLSDANSFDYVPDGLSDDVLEVAARGVKMTGNEPGGFRLNPNGLDTDYFDGNGNLSAQYHESHGAEHGHNFDNGKRDDTHLPMSPIRWN
ncbi:hypothetical protein [Caballeronia sp. Lep1P3]|uniref:hypothetical protein n=1 Tax=Caballeronia sp. Lep1P3 TaxID=2878150 RepID=UPI001FD0CE95|nr:hypothetical protein [Caballeronia sp. Lep1P3]